MSENRKWKKPLFNFSGIRFQEPVPSAKGLYRQNLAIALPATVEGALLSIIGSIDTMMVGRLGPAAIAAVGLTNQPRMVLLILAQALCVGTTALVARRKGAGDRAAANAVLSQSMYVMTLLGAIMMCLGFFGARPFMRFAGANEDTLELSVQYFRIISLGLMFNCWSLCLCAAMRAIGKTTITMVTNITANLVNVFLNYCLIGGHLGFPALGVRGAAIATATGTAVSCAIAFGFALKKDGYLRLRVSFPPKFDGETMRGLMTVGSGSIAESAFLRIGFLITSKLVAGIGTAEFAAYQIVSQVTSLSFTLGDGVATAGATMVGQSLGARRPDIARANVTIARRLSYITSALLMALILVFRTSVGRLFTTDEAVLTGVALAFWPVLLGVLPQNGRVVFSGCLRGAGDVKYVAACALISVTVLRPIFTWLFSYPMDAALPAWHFAVTGPWIAFTVDAWIRDLLLLRRVRRGEWLQIRL